METTGPSDFAKQSTTVVVALAFQSSASRSHSLPCDGAQIRRQSDVSPLTQLIRFFNAWVQRVKREKLFSYAGGAVTTFASGLVRAVILIHGLVVAGY